MRREDRRKRRAAKGFGTKRFDTKRFGTPKAARWRSAKRDHDAMVVLYGWHTVKAALENPQRHFLRLLATENAARRLAEDGAHLATDMVKSKVLAQFRDLQAEPTVLGQFQCLLRPGAPRPKKFVCSENPHL